MRMQNAGGWNRSLWFVWGVLAVMLGATGCSSMDRYIPPGRLPYDKLSAIYRDTTLMASTPLDIGQRMKDTKGTIDPKQVEREVITQGDLVVASSGRSREGVINWFTLVAFDRYSTTAVRKYFYYLNEEARVSPTNPTKVLFPPRTAMIFSMEAVITDVLASPHVSEEARKIAVVQYIAKQLQRDIQLLGVEDASVRSEDIVGVNGMFTNQIFRDALVELNKFPVLARELHTYEGVTFSNMSLHKGRIWLRIDRDIATVQIEFGVPVDKNPAVFKPVEPDIALASYDSMQ